MPTTSTVFRRSCSWSAAGRRRLSRVVCTASSSFRPTPHAGYHWTGSPSRFFEGWYWKVTIPENGESFALIYSVEDPQGNSPVSGVGAQVMGPSDSYILQYTRATNNFWATRNELELGCCFKQQRDGSRAPRRMVPKELFDQSISEGFQASYTWHQGSLRADATGAAGRLPASVEECSWAFEVTPSTGWGDAGGPQRPTAGWLSLLSVFEPHWQVLMAHGTASGWLKWGGEVYEFKDAPTYAEKNWGGGFPSKWHWIQCNSFNGHPGLSLTAVGARRGLLGVPGFEEDVGMIAVHYEGRFIELVPWTGSIQWDVAPWGVWKIQAKGSGYEALVEATCEAESGAVLRAPTADKGLAPFCKDSFFGTCRLRVWEVDSAGVKRGTPMVDATSSTAAVEVGGGPWWGSWKAEADMKEPFKSLVQLPLDVGTLTQFVPGPLRPPGL